MKRRWFFVIIVIILITSIGLYSRFIATKGLNVKEYKIENTKITDNFYGLKIIHLSDIHFGSTVNKADLEKMVTKVNLIKPDIIVLTGDLLTEEWPYDENELIEAMSKLNAKLGKYAVRGNHDFKVDSYDSIIEKIGFTKLDDNYDIIYQGSNDPIIISGIDSNYSYDEKKVKELNNYLNNLKENNIDRYYSILLIHEPDYIDNLNLDNYDLILAGHSHGGQVRLPIIGKIYTPEGSKKYYNGYYNVSNTDMYISSGMGTSGLKVRLFNRPSFNFYRLTN